MGIICRILGTILLVAGFIVSCTGIYVFLGVPLMIIGAAMDISGGVLCAKNELLEKIDSVNSFNMKMSKSEGTQRNPFD